jgi:hypothetical protein
MTLTSRDFLISDRKTLRFEDSGGQLIGLWVTHGSSILKKSLESLPLVIKALFPGEVFEDDSSRDGFKFCAVHMTQYNRYSEKVSPF